MPSAGSAAVRAGPIVLGLAIAYGLRLLLGIPYIVLLGLLQLETEASPEEAAALVESKPFTLGMLAIATAAVLVAGYVVGARRRLYEFHYGVYIGVLVIGVDVLLILSLADAFEGFGILDALGLLLTVPAAVFGGWLARVRALGAA